MSQDNRQQQELTRRIYSFLNEHWDTIFTVQELVEDRHIYRAKSSIQSSLNSLLRQGLIRVKNKGNELGYQAVLFQKTKSG
ncbi:MAG: hypothetical protein JW967_09070 [Dehalococcoidales bacterium]|nr:hypothetical protein [Dehalococcoidales bacterium]